MSTDQQQPSTPTANIPDIDDDDILVDPEMLAAEARAIEVQHLPPLRTSSANPHPDDGALDPHATPPNVSVTGRRETDALPTEVSVVSDLPPPAAAASMPSLDELFDDSQTANHDRDGGSVVGSGTNSQTNRSTGGHVGVPNTQTSPTLSWGREHSRTFSNSLGTSQHAVPPGLATLVAPTSTGSSMMGVKRASVCSADGAASQSSIHDTTTATHDEMSMSSTILSAASPTSQTAAGGPSSSAQTFNVGEFKQSFCPICLERYTLENPAILYDPCGHAFHFQCAESWLMRSPSCPVCSVPMSSGSGRVMTSADARQRKERPSAKRNPDAAAIAAASVEPLPTQATRPVSVPTLQHERRGSTAASSSSGLGSPTVAAPGKQRPSKKVAQPHHSHSSDGEEDDTPLLLSGTSRRQQQPTRGDGRREHFGEDDQQREEGHFVTVTDCATQEDGVSCEDVECGKEEPQRTPREQIVGTDGANEEGSSPTAVVSSPIGSKFKMLARTSLRKFGSICCW